MDIKAILVEDEEPARNLVKNYLSRHQNIQLIAECSDGFNGVKKINELKPDLIFLDIQMPKLDGFEVLELLEHKPAIIFTTAFDQYAIKAFEASATDYLLKPFSSERFSLAINKAIEQIHKNETDKTDTLIKIKDDEQQLIDRVAVKSGNKITIIDLQQIIYIESDGDYVSIHTSDGRFLKEKTMKYFEQHLDAKQFVRIHRTFIVNVNQINKIEHYDKENYAVVLKNQKSLRASQAGFKVLKNILNL